MNRPAPMRLAARALYNRREEIAARADRLRSLSTAVGFSNDLNLAQWCHLYAVAREFRPDLIIELGRLYGNSTCVFTQAAHDLGDGRVVSICRSDIWQQKSWPKVRAVVEPGWENRLDARVGDIAAADYAALTHSAERVMVFWDAHGIAVADTVLARLMPLIAGRPHVVVMHDVSDARYSGGGEQAYGGQMFWRGQFLAHEGRSARLRLGWIDTAVNQVIPVVDFLSRNGLELQSADHDVQIDIVDQPDRLQALRQALPETCFATVNHWAYFTLNDVAGAPDFPAYGGAAADDAPFEASDHAVLGQVLCRDLKMYTVAGRATPLTWARILAKTSLGHYRDYCT